MRSLSTISLFKNLLVLISIAPFNSNAQWTQKGIDIDGEAANDRSGASVSMPSKNTMAIGAFSNDGNGIDAGHVRVYDWNGAAWIQRGVDIDGEAVGDESGFSVDMPDSNTLAIGARRNDATGVDAGHVRIYSWNGSAWIQKGSDIDGEAAGDQFGISVSMPDSNTIAIGGRLNDGTAIDAGHVRVFKWNGSSWLQLGVDIDGEAASDDFGFSVNMPDTLTLAVGAYRNDGNGNGSGHTRVFRWNGNTWIQKGLDIDGEAAGDASGVSVNMPDSNTIAIGAYANSGNGNFSGHARIYIWNGTSWVQKGADIDGEAGGDLSGYCVNMPNANTIAIGAPGNAGNGNAAGHVRVYKWNGSSWSQLGLDLDGEASLDQSGIFVFMPDTTTIAIGAPNNSGFAQYAGHVRIFEYNLPTSLKETTSSLNFSIYPNPTKADLTIETINSIGEIIQITSITGAVLKEITISQNKEIVNLKSYKNGLYFLRFRNKMHKIILTD